MEETNSKNVLGVFNIALFILSIYVLVILVVDNFWVLPTEVSKILFYVDNFICAIFFLDFLYQLIKAPKKLEYLKWGWIDLLSSIPSIDIFRAARIVRIVRVVRVIRAIKSAKIIYQMFFANRRKGAASSIFLFAFTMILFSSILILQFETAPESNIKTAEEAIWWSFVTITTVGYGDFYPITTGGRLLATVLMISGIGIFGTFTGFVSSWLLGGKNEN